MRSVELTGTLAASPPLHQWLAGFVELHDACVRVAVADQETAVFEPIDRRRPVKVRQVLVIAPFAGNSEGLQELLAVM